MTQETRLLTKSHLFAQAADAWAIDRGFTISAGASQILKNYNNLNDLTDANVARINLGLRIGSDVQAHSTVLDRYVTSPPSDLALALLTQTTTHDWRSSLGLTGSNGTVTSVDLDGGTTGLSAYGGPIVSSGTLTLDGTLSVAHGGTGVSTLAALKTALNIDKLSSLSDVSVLTTPVQDQVLSWNNTTSKWNPVTVPIAALDTDAAFNANSDVKIPSQKAVKTYVDGSLTSTKIDAVGGDPTARGLANISALTSTTISSSTNQVALAGYYSIGDGGNHIRKRGVSTDPGAVQSIDGAWWVPMVVNGNEIHVKHFGAKFDGASDDTVAINVAISALTAIANSFSPAATYKLILPPGRAITQGGHILPNTIKAVIEGAGRMSTILYLKNGANTYILDVKGQGSTVTGIWFGGNRANNPTGLEGLRINASYCTVRDVWISECGGDGLAVGSSASAIASNFEAIRVRLCVGYGVNIYGSTSTDCQWTDVDVGNSGKSGLYLGSSAQQMTNVHTWGNGLGYATDNHGFNMVSGGHLLTNCEGETNLGKGAYAGSGISGIQITGGSWWGNCSNGIYFFGNSHNSVVGAVVKNNGVTNTAGASSVAFANVCYGQCTYNTLASSTFYDDGTAIAAGTYSPYTPTYPYPGRTASVFTVYSHYAEQTGSNFNTITGNSMPAAQSRGNNAIINIGAANLYQSNLTGETTLPTVASAATLTIPPQHPLVQVTGTVAVTAITAQAKGARVTLVFAAAGCVITSGSNLALSGNYTSTVGSALTLICDGTNWYRQTSNNFDRVANLVDVDLTTPQTQDQSLTWNATTSKWVPATVLTSAKIDAVGGDPTARSVMPIASIVALSSTNIAAGVNYIRTNAYYADTLEINAGARWQRSPVQSAGNGRRQSGDGAWWQIAEQAIDPKMLGARSSDRTTISTTAILEAINITNDSGRQSMGGSRKVIFSPPATAAAYPAYSGAYVVDAEIVLIHGVSIEIMSGAEVLAAPTFTGKAVFSSLDAATWQARNVTLQVDGIINANSIADLCVFPRTAQAWRIYGNGELRNGLKGGLQLGSSTTSYKPFECHIGPLRIQAPLVTTYAAAATGNASDSIGLWMAYCTDNFVNTVEIIGYRTGYQDDGGNNNISRAHTYAFGRGSNIDGTGSFTGPLSCGFRFNGSACQATDIYADTPTSMGNGAITDVYGMEFGASSTGVVIQRAKVLLNWDNLSRTDTFSSNICSAINHLSNNQDNYVGYLDLRSVNSSSIKFKLAYSGSGLGRLPRENVTVQSSILQGGTGDITFERPSLRTKLTANKKHNYLDNAAFQIWQRGAGSFDATPANTRVFGPDRWFSISDGSGGGRAISRATATPTEAYNAQYLKSPYLMRLTRTGSGTSETYWKIMQVCPAGLLAALQNQAVTFKLFIRLISGSFAGAIKVGVEQGFGSGGSTTVNTEATLLTGSSGLSSNLGGVTTFLTVPSISGKVIGTNAYLGFYMSMPITGPYVVDLADFLIADGYENILFQLPNEADELNRAQRYYESVDIITPNGSQFIQCQPKASVPTVSTTVGTTGTVTTNGALITHTSNVASSVAFTCAEP